MLSHHRKSAKWIFTHLPLIKNLVRVICLGVPTPYLESVLDIYDVNLLSSNFTVSQLCPPSPQSRLEIDLFNMIAFFLSLYKCYLHGIFSKQDANVFCFGCSKVFMAVSFYKISVFGKFHFRKQTHCIMVTTVSVPEYILHKNGMTFLSKQMPLFCINL